MRMCKYQSLWRFNSIASCKCSKDHYLICKVLDNGFLEKLLQKLTVLFISDIKCCPVRSRVTLVMYGTKKPGTLASKFYWSCKMIFRVCVRAVKVWPVDSNAREQVWQQMAQLSTMLNYPYLQVWRDIRSNPWQADHVITIFVQLICIVGIKIVSKRTESWQ